MINVNVSRVCIELQVLSKTASRLWLYAYKKYKNGQIKLCKTYILTTSHPVSHNPEQEWQFRFGNIWKITRNSNFERQFLENGWSYRHEILRDNLEDRAQWSFQNCVHSTSTLILVDLYRSKCHIMRNTVGRGKQAAGQSRAPGRVMWTKCLPRDSVQLMEVALRNSNEIICKHRKLRLQVPGKVSSESLQD